MGCLKEKRNFKTTSHICTKCGKQFNRNGGYQIEIKFCSMECKKVYYGVPVSDLPYLSSATKGSLSELLVCTDLMKLGYDVFRAMSTNTNCDVVGIKNNIILQLEVRTGIYYPKEDGTIMLNYPKARKGSKCFAVVTLSDCKVHYIDFNPSELINNENKNVI